jgi:hypothetical protein
MPFAADWWSGEQTHLLFEEGQKLSGRKLSKDSWNCGKTSEGNLQTFARKSSDRLRSSGEGAISYAIGLAVIEGR